MSERASDKAEREALFIDQAVKLGVMSISDARRALGWTDVNIETYSEPLIWKPSAETLPVQVLNIAAWFEMAEVGE